MPQAPPPLRRSLGPLIKTAIFTVLVPGTVGGWIPYRLLARPDRGFWDLGALRYLGLIPLGLGTAIYLWCAWDFAVAGRGTPAPIDPPKELVARGLYRWTRNPMYVGVLAVILGQAVLFEAPIVAGYAALVFTFFHLFVLLYEEPMLSSKFGAAYGRYRASVPRWLPWRRSAFSE